MATEEGNIIRLKKSTLHSVSILIKKSTYQDYEPREKDLYLRDTELKGFYIRIRPNGNRTYNVGARLNGIGKRIYITIGDCDLFTAQEARELARELLVKIKTGINPKDEIKKEEATSKTIEMLCQEYVEIRPLAESTKKDYLYRVPQQLGKLANKDIKDLNVQDFVFWWRNAKAKESAKVALRYVSALLNYAKVMKYVTENVAQDFRRGVLGGIPTKQPKQTHISRDEIDDWVASFIKQSIPHQKYLNLKDKKGINAYWDDEPTIRDSVRDYILFLLLTGKRKTEVSSLTWKNVDFEKLTITLEKTKSGKTDIIPMTNLLWHMLVYRNEAPSKHPEFVFPNRYRSGPIIDIRRALQKIDMGSGKEHTTAHDLRRTFATMTKELGMTNQDTAILLNHSKRDVTEGYIMVSWKIKRANLDKVEQLILSHISGWIKVYWYEGKEDWDQGPSEPVEEREYYI